MKTKPFYDRCARSRHILAACSLAIAVAVRMCSAQPLADRVYGQPNLNSSTPNNSGVPASSQLSTPKGVSVSADGVYITDYDDNRTLFFPGGSTTATFVYGQPDLQTMDRNTGGLNASSESRPEAVFANATGVYVADYRNSRVLHYPTGVGTADRVYGQPHFGASEPSYEQVTARTLNYPAGVTADNNGNCYVVDTGDNRILYYPAGTNVATRIYGESDFNGTNSGTTAGTFYAPSAATVDNTGLYVVDYGNNRVLFFPTGSLTATRVYGQPDFNVGLANNGGIGPSTLYQPAGVAVDDSGVYISDSGNARILYYPGTSTVATAVYGEPDFVTTAYNPGGVSASGIFIPYTIAVDQYNLYVCDSLNARILRYPKANQPLPNGLAFSIQPGGGTAGGSLTGQPAVTVTHLDGSPATEYNGAVHLSVQPVTGSPAYATLGGSVTVNAVAGVATFTGLSIDTPGSYHLVASLGTLAPTNSQTITVAAAGPSTVLGDVDRSGTFNMADATLMLRVWAGLDAFPHGS